MSFILLENQERVIVSKIDWDELSNLKWVKGKDGQVRNVFCLMAEKILNRKGIVMKSGDVIIYRNGNKLDCRRGNIMVGQ
jgi:hypothetical protein